MKSTPTVSTTPQPATKQRGFTLIELVIAMVIAAILASLAIPAYSSYVRKSRRTEAKTALLDMASLEERFFSTQNSYTSTPADLGFGTAATPLTTPFAIGSGYYNITAITPTAATAPAPPTTPAGTPASFVITATAINDQLKDTQCRTFTVSSNGTQTSQDSSGTDTTATCWK